MRVQRTFQVDAWAPTVSITAPTDGTILANSPTPFAVQAQASDRGYGFTLEDRGRHLLL